MKTVIHQEGLSVPVWRQCGYCGQRREILLVIRCIGITENGTQLEIGASNMCTLCQNKKQDPRKYFVPQTDEDTRVL